MATREHSLLIEKAVHAVGGEQRLCALLGVSWEDLHGWLDAGASMPNSTFLRLVDILEGAPASAPAQPAPQPFLEVGYTAGSRIELLETALDAVLTVAGTELGTLQVMDAEGTLRIAFQRGFDAAFLGFVAGVKDPESACGVALMTGRQYAVADVVTHPVFRDTKALETLLAAGVRAVASTPIPSAAGRALGMISVHFREPHAPEVSVMALLARIARRAGAWLELDRAR